MKATRIIPFAICLSGVASQSTNSLLELLTEIPACALQCITPAIAECNATTVPGIASCICPNVAVKKDITTCVIQQLPDCNYTAALGALTLSSELCEAYPRPSRSYEVITSTAVLLAITIPFVTLRFVSRLAITKQLWWDDLFIFIATVVLVSQMGINIALTELGLGKHLWDVKGANIIPLLKMFYYIQLAYIIVQVLTKISLLLFLLRIFPQRWFRYTTWATIAFVALHGIAFLFVVSFQCLPVNFFWERYVGGKCLDAQVFTYAGAGFSIFEDFFILLLPIPCLKSLNIKLGQKIALIAMFSLGSLACITSIARLRFLSDFKGLGDATWDDTPTCIWSVIENCVAVICACLPTLRPLLARLFPRAFGTTNRRSALPSSKLSKSFKSSRGSQRMEVMVETEMQLQSGRHSPITPMSATARGETELWSPVTKPEVSF